MIMDSKVTPDRNLIEYLETNFEKFTSTQKALANYLLSSTDEAPFLTADEMAAKINTTSSTVVRFAKEIGYSGYPDLQKDLQKLIIKKINAIGQLEQAKLFKAPEKETVINLSLMKNLANLNKLIEMRDEENIKKFVDVIISSRRKYVIASRSAFCLGHFFFFETKKIISDVFLLNDFDGGIFDVFRELSSEDVIIVFSFPRFAKLTVDFAQYAEKKGVKVIAVTDSRTSPLFNLSKVCLFCPYEGVIFHKSHVAGMALINAIISEIFSRNHDLAIQNLEKEESILLDLDVIALKTRRV